MPTFLQLVEDLARESGGTARAPTSVVGQTGRQEKLVGWVRGAWLQIQNLHAYWTFLRSEWVGSMTIGQASYTPAQIAFSDPTNALAAPRFGEFLGDADRYTPTTIYDPALGRKDENALRQVPWERWRMSFDRGVMDDGRPGFYCLAPDGTFRADYVPDKAFVLRGEYRKTPQRLEIDADVPDMPERFHEIIVWRAIQLMASSDEAPLAMNLADDKYRELKMAMERDCLPRFRARAGRPLA